MERVVLGLGSNVRYEGLDPCSILSKACSELSLFLKDMKVSSIYRTAAMYVTAQADFYNMVVTGLFGGTPRELLFKIHRIEDSFGRDRSREIRFGPRPLDIDIELFGDMEISEPDLVIPHERMTERSFVLVPYIEILEKDADSDKNKTAFYKDCLSSLEGQKIEMWGGILWQK